MNPKGPSSLDPKLREAYERIMSGSNAQQPAQTPDSMQASQLPQQPPIENPTIQPPQQGLEPNLSGFQSQEQQKPLMQTQVVEENSLQNPNLTPSEQDITSSPLLKGGVFNPLAQNQTISQTQDEQTNPIANGDSPSLTPKPKKKNGLMSFILGVGVVIFLIAYAVIWAKVFGLF